MSPYLRWLSARFAEHAAPDVRFQTASRHVIGYAAGMSAEELGPFVRSLRTWFDDEVTLVVNPDPDVSDLLDAYEVRGFVFPRIIGWLPDLATSRLASFEHLLRQAGAGASVLLTDVRNVVFQGDPLSPPPLAIEPFAADEGQPGLDGASDQAWLDVGAGRKVAALLSQTSALCAGVVAGPAASLARLCRTMLTTSIPHDGKGGAEALIQLNLTEADIQPTPYRVAVVGSSVAKVRVIDGIVVNADGTVSPVLGGYHRHPRLLEAVGRRWSGQSPRRTRRHGRRILVPLETSPDPTEPCACQ